MRLATAFAALCAFAVSTPALAQAPDFQGQHHDWRVFTRGSGAERVCYAVTRPTDSRPGTVDHGQAFHADMSVQAFLQFVIDHSAYENSELIFVEEDGRPLYALT